MREWLKCLKIEASKTRIYAFYFFLIFFMGIQNVHNVANIFFVFVTFVSDILHLFIFLGIIINPIGNV